MTVCTHFVASQLSHVRLVLYCVHRALLTLPFIDLHPILSISRKYRNRLRPPVKNRDFLGPSTSSEGDKNKRWSYIRSPCEGGEGVCVAASLGVVSLIAFCDSENLEWKLHDSGASQAAQDVAS